MVWIDKSLCSECGACVNICPDGFELEGDVAVLKDPDASCIRAAMSACPVGAIRSAGEPTDRAVRDQGIKPNQTAGSGHMSGRSLGRGMGRGSGRGRGMGRGKGRGMGRGGGMGRGRGK